MEPIRVMLADPQTLFREGLKALLAGCDAVEIVGDVLHPDGVAECLDAASPDVVLMEVGRAASQAIRSARPDTRVVFLTNRQDEDALFDYRESGAAGYILKDTALSELVGAIRTIHDGGSWVSAGVAGRMSGGEAKSRQGILTRREQEVLKMTAEGRSVKEVAAILDLSAKTVDAHKVNLMRKLRIHNKAQLVQWAYQNQVLKLEYEGWR
jgi:two-component system response regulator NreC